MPKATRKNMMIDKSKGRGGEWNGGDVDWMGNNVPDKLTKFMKDMKLIDDSYEAPKSGLMNECIVAGGALQDKMILVKNRDRSYEATVSIVRKLSKDGTEMVLMYDKNSRFVEGMNEYGIGIINATLRNREDSQPMNNYNNRLGNIIHRALCCKNLPDALLIVSTYNDGVEGHTIVGDALRMYTVENSWQKKAIVTQTSPTDSWEVRTNHGLGYYDAGYKPKDGNNYIGSHIRRAMAEVELSAATSEKDVMKALRKQHFAPESNYNMHRRTRGIPGSLFTTSQVMMNLSDLVFNFHTYDDYINYIEMVDKTPKGYEPKIKIVITNSAD